MCEQALPSCTRGVQLLAFLQFGYIHPLPQQSGLVRAAASLRTFIMRSASELLIFIFRSEKRMGLLMQSDFAKCDGIKSDLRIRWPKSSDFGPKSDDSTHRIIQIEKWHRSLIKKNLTEQSRPGTAAVRGTHKSTCTSSDRCVGLRKQTRCANAIAAPHCSQTTASCRSTRART